MLWAHQLEGGLTVDRFDNEITKSLGSSSLDVEGPVTVEVEVRLHNWSLTLLPSFKSIRNEDGLVLL